MTTYRRALALTGTTVPDHLVADAEVPVLTGAQAQGDLLVFRQGASPTLRWQILPAEGRRLVEGEATGNTHWLHPGFESTGVLWADPDGGPPQRLGWLRVPPGQSALLIHTDEHGANGIGPGVYVVHRKRELSRDTDKVEETRLVAD